MSPSPAQILTHTPAPVWGILAALLVLGLLQTRDRIVSRPRVLLLPVAMSALSLHAALKAFAAAAGGLPVLPAWAAGFALGWAANLVLRWPGRVEALAPGRWRVAGSWAPLALMLAIFVLRYAVGVALALQPALGTDLGVAAGCTLLYGLASGLLAARAHRVLGHRSGGSAPAAAGQAAATAASAA